MKIRQIILKFWWTWEDCADRLARLPYFRSLESWYPSAKYEKFPKIILNSGQKYENVNEKIKKIRGHIRLITAE